MRRAQRLPTILNFVLLACGVACPPPVVADAQAPTDQAVRKAIPTDAEQKSAEVEIRKLLKKEFAAATTPANKAGLANLLMKAAETESEPVKAFVRLKLAGDLYAESRQLDRALAVADALNEQFQFAGKTAQADVLKAAARTMRDPVTAAELARVCLDQADKAAGLRDFAAANGMATLAKSAAQTAKHRHYQTIAPLYLREFGTLQKEAERLAPFRDALQTDPSNREAATESGRFQYLLLQDRTAGLQQLAAGNDAELRTIAELALMNPTDAAGLSALGELWLEQSIKLPQIYRPAAQALAHRCFMLAVLASTPDNRLVLQKRLAQLPRQYIELRFSLKQDGHSELHISQTELRWRQLAWTAPDTMQVNTQVWSIDKSAMLPNRGATRYLFDEVLFQTAVVKQLDGRGTVTLKAATSETAVIDLRDEASGDDKYEFVVGFGN